MSADDNLPAVQEENRKPEKSDDYDSPWKIALDNYLEEFLDFYFPNISEKIDWKFTPKSLDVELLGTVKDSGFGRNRADKIVEVRLKGGNKQLLNIHIEVQSQKDKDFERRMFTYHYRIFDRYGKPPLSLAVLADKSAKWRPKAYSHQIFEEENQLTFAFKTVKLLDYELQLDELMQSTNAFGLLTAAHLLTKQTRSNSSVRRKSKLKLVRLLYNNGWDRQKILDFFAILDWLMSLSEVEALKFKSDLEQLEEEINVRYVTSIERIGREEGRQEGKQEGEKNALQRVIFNLRADLGLTTEKIAEVVKLPLETVQQYIEQSEAVSGNSRA